MRAGVSWADRHDRHTDLAAATGQAVDAFALRTHTIDYRHRRDRLREWTIPAEIWSSIVLPLRDWESIRWRQELDDIKRLTVSALIWRDLTAGDLTACPIYLNRKQLADIEPEQLACNLLRTANNYDLAQTQGSTTNHMVRLMAALAAYRRQLEHDIDTHIAVITAGSAASTTMVWSDGQAGGPDAARSDDLRGGERQ
jgi:hypothetical protein